MHTSLALRLAAAVVLAAPAVARAQASVAAGDSLPCTYSRCALGIAPRWNGLVVVRGAERLPVANLEFFRSRDVSGAFAGDSSRLLAGRAMVQRGRAAVLTDAGVVMLLAGVVRGLAARRADGTSRALAATGAAAFALSVPLQFSADGLLERAVWWHNARFAR